MKIFIFIPVIILAACLMLNGCYTYLSLSNGAKLAEVRYEPDFPPDPSPPPPPCIDCDWPQPRPIIVIINPLPEDSKPHYQRPKNIGDVRNGSEGRNSENDRRRR